MGGDDLESDDEYLLEATTVESRAQSVKNGLRSGDAAVKDTKQSLPSSLKSERTSKKKKWGGADNGSSDDAAGFVQSPKKRKKPTKKEPAALSGKNLLIEAGRGLAEQDADVQAAFLTTCYNHALQMDAEDGGENDSDGGDLHKFETDDFYVPSAPISTGAPGGHHRSMAAFLRGGALSSFKRLKKWKHLQSPMVLVVTISARRAVSILKDLSSLNLRCAKLFAKHMDVEDQRTQLKTNPFGIAVGTPNRLWKLFKGDDGGADGVLRFDRTELIVLDCHEDHKRYTVCTLNDTAPDLMQLLRDAAFPELRRRKTIKLAMF